MATTVQQSFREFAERLDGSSLDDQGAAADALDGGLVSGRSTYPTPTPVEAASA